MKQKHRIISYLVLGIVVAILMAVYFIFPDIKNFASPDFVREYLLGFGIWSYPIFMLLLIVAVPLPLPTTPIALGGGYLYGTLQGSLLSLIAVVIGSTISFYLVRFYGQPLLEKLIDKHHLEHFQHIFKKRGATAAFISYVIPIFPSDCVSLFLGLTKMKYRTFLFIVILGHIPRFLIINSLGDDLLSGFSWITLIVILAALLLILIAIFREKLKLIFFKELQELEKGLKLK
tara:strand:+ start:1829 stop:2524 length:696 start_codon:yes stop_codon:yes gene_type:complete